jgi:D-alanyl-lipoteichoic acid acyltransferase DltB (MBOAT superfamily)
MAFNSLEFPVFLAAVIFVYFIVSPRARSWWLLAASMFFYAVAGPVFLLQILVISAVIFWFGLAIEAAAEKSRRQTLLVWSILLLVANLVAFKYTSFLNESLRTALSWFNLPYPVPAIEWLLPLGISFYTFQLLSYVIDVYRDGSAERRLGVFLLFVMLFPKVISGPIERGRHLLPQLHVEHHFDLHRAFAGLQLMLWGAFKKIVVADRIAPFVNQVYDDPRAAEGVTTVFATLLYAFQIYFDFSGYTDMALGAALVLGFKLMENFDRPYFATSIQDFWKRCHISLTSWLTDYVYNPLSRARFIKIKWYNLMLISIFVTFVVSGFWHGARWNFVAWGALHGFYIVAAIMLQKRYDVFARAIGLMERKRLHRALKIGVTFSLVCFAYILFRANSLDDAAYIVTHLHTGWDKPLVHLRTFIGGQTAEFMLAIAGIVIVMAPEFAREPGQLYARFNAAPAWTRWAVCYAGVVSIILLGAHWGNKQQFIYFRF